MLLMVVVALVATSITVTVLEKELGT